MNSPVDAQPELPSVPSPQRRKVKLTAPQGVGLLMMVIIIVGYYAFRTSHRYYVQYVVDGDTFVIRYRGQMKFVQLAGADAPELNRDERYAPEAYRYLIDRIEHKNVYMEFLDAGDKLDYKDRFLCWVWIEGDNLSYELVGQGLAKFSGAAEGHARRQLTMLEDEARRNKRGLWSPRTASFEPPQ